MKYKISVIVPIYNEEETLEKTVMDLVNFLEKECEDYEIIIVDSNSSDKSEIISKMLCKQYKKVKAIRQKEKKGIGNGLREGYANCNLDYVWYRDADFPYKVSELKKSFPYLKDYDAVIGYKSGKRENLFRKIISIVYNKLVKILFNLKFRDINYSYKIIRKDVLKKLDLRSDGWFIDAEILIELKKGGYKIKEVCVPYTIRKGKGSKVSGNYIQSIYRILKEMFQYIQRKKP